jgi:hypothetical protein
VIVSDDQRIWVTDATFGQQLQRVETRVATPRHVDVVGETIVVWGSESVEGISSETLTQIWSQAAAPIANTIVIEAARALRVGASSDQARRWVAFRFEGESEWRLLNVADGQAVFEVTLGEFDELTALVVDSERLLLAGWVAGRENEGERHQIRLSAFDLRDGTPLWSRDFSTAVAVNATQLAAHPELIPVLLAGVGGEAVAETELPAIQLVNKRDGQPGEPFSIKADYRPVVEATCEMYMLVTPTRMIVQAGGNLLAYGNSPLRSGP